MSSSSAIETLEAVVANAVALIQQLQAVVANIATQKDVEATDSSTVDTHEAHTGQSDSIDIFSLAHDSVTLIRAHSTKISLLIINEPFTPTAIAKVVRELVAGPLPALASAVQLCRPEKHTRVIQQDLAWRAGLVLKELKELVARIPKDGKILSDQRKNASAGAVGGKGSIAATAVLWSACDDLTAFAKRGFAGNMVYKVEQLRDTLKDVMEELKEWGEETDDDDEDDDDDVNQIADDLETTSLSGTQDAQAMLDDLMNSQQHIPRDDPEKIRERLESCLKRLRLTTLLYQAAVKRRLKALPKLPPSPDSKVAARLDEIWTLLKRIPDSFESLALAFYELDPSEIDRLMDQCFFDAFAASELLVKPWDGQDDEFTKWAQKFQVEIKKG